MSLNNNRIIRMVRFGLFLSVEISRKIFLFYFQSFELIWNKKERLKDAFQGPDFSADFFFSFYFRSFKLYMERRKIVEFLSWVVDFFWPFKFFKGRPPASRFLCRFFPHSISDRSNYMWNEKNCSIRIVGCAIFLTSTPLKLDFQGPNSFTNFFG